MKTCTNILALFALGIVLAVGTARAQTGSLGTTLDESVDAADLALGESSVARVGEPGAWNSNPATLASVRGVGGRLGTRSLPWNLGDATGYYTLGGWCATPIGTFQLDYQLLDLGDFVQVFENGSTGQIGHSYEHIAALSYAVAIPGGAALGATVKRYANSFTRVASDTLLPGGEISASGFWFDLGATYSAGNLFASDEVADTLHTGISVQSIGGDLTYPELSATEPIVRRLRIGAAYELSLRDTGSIPQFSASFSAEYRRVLNPPQGYENRRNQVGIGVEATLFDLVSVRLGTTLQSYNDVYATQDKALLRYGLGVNAPLSRLGSDIPLAFGLDYGVVPVADQYTGARDVKAFTLHIGYTGSLFD